MRKRVLLTVVLIASLLSLLWLASSQFTASRSLTKANPSPAPSMPSKEAVSAKLATLERGWVKNEGQWDERALFSAPGYFGNTWITKDGELVHVAIKGKESWVISERWVGGKVQTIKGEEELQTKVSYFIGNDPSKHKTNLPTYRYVSLGEVWSGIEVKLKATQKTVEKLFYVQPGADPSKIAVEVDGAKGLKLSKDGEIIIQTGLGDLKLSKPVAWQEKDGKKLPVEVSYKLIGKNRYSFEVAKADPSLPIVIDPILQATYLGGTGGDGANAIAISGSDIYVVGITNSNNFPGTSGRALSRTDDDAFVAKLNSSLNLSQVTYLGGSGNDSARALAISGGEVYVVGYTDSNNFPEATPRDSSRIDFDAFVAKLNSSLNLSQATYLGGSGEDGAYALAISGGEVYVVGITNSNNFPEATPRDSSRIDFDAFVAKLNSSFSLSQATYLGGSGSDFAYALAISGSEVYVVGATNSNNFPEATPRASSRTDYDAFVAKLNSSLNLSRATYLGGSDDDFAYALAISGSEVYVVGYTDSNNFPGTTPRASSRTDYDAFVAKLNSSLNLSRATYLGGSGDDSASALAISGSDIYVVGVTRSNNFPGATPRASSRTDDDAFVAKLSADLTGGGGGSGGGGSGGGGGGGCSMTGSSSASLWNILVWLSVPLFALARRIRRK